MMLSARRIVQAKLRHVTTAVSTKKGTTTVPFTLAFPSVEGVTVKINPLLVQQSSRQWSTYAATSYQNHAISSTTIRCVQVVERWKKNIARLYARRIMELAIASLALYKVRQQGAMGTECFFNAKRQPTLIDKPTRWQNWQQQDWEETAMASLGTSKLQRFWMATSRMVQLAVLVSPLAVLYPLSFVSDSAQTMAWSYALWGIEQAGPTWIKLVQWATTRQDLFSPEFCQYFGKLRDDTEGHSWKETQKILEEEFGKLVATNTLQINPEPIGSGCIAQVYQGTLLQPSGQYPKDTKVAIKVQHPGIWDKVCTDFYILHKAAKWLESIPNLNLQMLSLSDTVRQFRDIMIPQLDLTLEANHLRRFNQDFAQDDHVNFPNPLRELTTSQVLVETFVEGTPIMEYTKAGDKERHQLALLGLETVLKMIFLNDFVHGDLHPGNILVSGSYPNLKLQILDCGLVLEMGPDQHVNLVKVLGAFTRRDGRLAGQLMVDLKSETQATPYDVEMFIRGIEQICVKDGEQNFLESVGDYLADICYLACVHKVKLESAFINAALAVEIMEGIAAALYPDMHVQGIALPLVVKAEMMHRLGLH